MYADKSVRADHRVVVDEGHMARKRRDNALGSNLMLAPLVVAMRLPVMAKEARHADGGKEMQRAVAEKSAAFAEGVVAAQVSMFGSMMSFWPEIMSGRTPSMLTGAAAERSLHAALSPAGKQVRANYRRLSKR